MGGFVFLTCMTFFKVVSFIFRSIVIIKDSKENFIIIYLQFLACLMISILCGFYSVQPEMEHNFSYFQVLGGSHSPWPGFSYHYFVVSKTFPSEAVLLH